MDPQDAEPRGAPSAGRVQGPPLLRALHDAGRAVAGGAGHAAGVGARVLRGGAGQRTTQGGQSVDRIKEYLLDFLELWLTVD